MFHLVLSASPSPAPTSSASGLVIAGVSLLVSVAGALGVSSLVAAAVSARQQRIRDLRETLLAASDNFLTSSVHVYAALQNLKPREGAPGLAPWLIDAIAPSGGDVPPEERVLRERLTEEARTALADAAAKLRRVQLLFGPDSPAARQANDSVHSLQIAAFSIDSYYQSQVGQSEQAEPDSFDKALRLGRSILSVAFPAQSALIGLGANLGGRVQDILQDRSAENSRQKATELYEEAAEQVVKSLDEFVKSVCDQLHRLDHSPWFRQGDLWIINRDERIQRHGPDGEQEEVDRPSQAVSRAEQAGTKKGSPAP